MKDSSWNTYRIRTLLFFFDPPDILYDCKEKLLYGILIDEAKFILAQK